MFICIFGGQFGSEGKGSASEYFAKQAKLRNPTKKLAVFGENSPNSGHTCSLGKTRNLPAASFFADVVVLGPDSVIDNEVLELDIQTIEKVRNGFCPQIFIHSNAALCDESNIRSEKTHDLATKIGSTGSGSGSSRIMKYYLRSEELTIGSTDNSVCKSLNTFDYLQMVDELASTHNCIFECSQGVLLDTNFGYYPYVTSRTTLPRCATERNGVGHLPWIYAGVYRTYPIRTGGNSGPTGGPEISWESIGQTREIATVTKRIRRIFEFSTEDYKRSVKVARPDVIMFTHLDYINVKPDHFMDFMKWTDTQKMPYVNSDSLFLSNETGKFHSICDPVYWMTSLDEEELVSGLIPNK